MIPIFISGPAVEPVTLAEMKAYLRVDDDDGAQDDLISGLIKAARLMVEAASRRILVEQRWRVVLDAWPANGTILLPLSPLIAVDRITVADAAGTAAEIPPGTFESDTLSDPPRLAVSGAPQPGKVRHGIAIELRAGFGATAEAVPASLRLAIRILVAHWFENRGDVTGEQILPPEALALVAPFQRARL
ncbi:putative phiE125 gp8 family phage protein [Microvirga flocculans]|uniref:Putative phiE125 gp8 family phage protein n=1 Tax=Microvirga flocculans TaxID=217168 RepID=A0A7W6IHF1_9HYPH|nr:head-tail connector protein [Microvirga flocculans]MBB4041409.1 putative phiE125 gp8 family phage protein [Microvirga flocculans]